MRFDRGVKFLVDGVGFALSLWRIVAVIDASRSGAIALLELISVERFVAVILPGIGMRRFEMERRFRLECAAG
jgi:hypothetical protein